MSKSIHAASSFSSLYLYDDNKTKSDEDQCIQSDDKAKDFQNGNGDGDRGGVQSDETKPQNDLNSGTKVSANTGIIYGSISVFISILGAALTFPFLQAQRDSMGCDALCYGSMQSARSGLSLIGNVFVGRMSDRFGRIPMLWVGLAASLSSYTINYFGNSVEAMWLSMIPSSLLNQNFTVSKALFGDYNTEAGGVESDRASAMGRLGMVVGIAFMVGPAVGATYLKDYYQAQALAMILTFISAFFLLLLPTPKLDSKAANKTSESQHADDTKSGEKQAESIFSFHKKILSFLYLPAAQTPGAKLLFFMRAGMALAFNVFMTVWTVSLKERFNFGPKGHAYFMGWVGLCYALSQGLLAKIFIKQSGEDPTNVLLLCIIGLSFGRVFAMLTTSLVTVYAIMAFVIVALGVMNTAMSSACSHLAGVDQVGGLFGIMEAVESLAGLVGPALGGFLFRLGKNVPLISVVIIYLLVFVAVFLFYRDTIVNAKSHEKESSETAAAMRKKDDDIDIKKEGMVESHKVESLDSQGLHRRTAANKGTQER